MSILVTLPVFADSSSEATLTVGQKIILTGKVMDTDENWLNDVSVSMTGIDTQTNTDPNGDFTIEFLWSNRLKKMNVVISLR